MCERMHQDGRVDLQQAKRSWQQAEEADLNRREHKLSAKLKKDAAKAVEPKLKHLMEMNTEELARLQRQSAREIDSYRVELFGKLNKEFKTQADKIRETERQRTESIEKDWMVKLEEVRARHCAEMDKAAKDHEVHMQMQRQQHDTVKQRIIHEHKAAMEDNQRLNHCQMEEATLKHDREMKSLHTQHKDRVRNRREEVQM